MQEKLEKVSNEIDTILLFLFQRRIVDLVCELLCNILTYKMRKSNDSQLSNFALVIEINNSALIFVNKNNL